jgi:predicted AAA+ superfamily ATPase
MDEFGVKNGTIITYDKEGEEEIKDMKILYISLRNWLLEFKNVS